MSCQNKAKELEQEISKLPGCKLTRGGCDPDPGISCSGDDVTQDVLHDLMTMLKRVKSQPDGSVHIKALSVFETKLVELDLAPFTGVQFDSLSISHNNLLTSIKNPVGGSGSSKIMAKNLHFSFHPKMSDQGFGHTLNYFDVNALYGLNLWDNNFHGSRGTGNVKEFLPGLSAFEKLSSLELAMNKISELGERQFEKNNKLSFLNLSQNPLKKITADALAFNEIDSGDEYWQQDYKTIVIRLSECQLTSGAFVDNKIEWTRQRPIHLQIMDNKLDTLAPAIFKDLLNANENNEVIVTDNPIIYNEATNWLTQHREKFGTRIDFDGFKK